MAANSIQQGLVTEAHLEFCETEKQAEVINTLLKCGSMRKAAEELNCAFSNVQAMCTRIVRRAEQRGYSPKHDLTHTIPATQVLRGVSTLYTKNGVSAQWVKTRTDNEALAKEIIEGIKDALEEYNGKSKNVQHLGFSTDETMACYVMGDAHFGMLAHEEETKVADFDSEIAYRVMQGAIQYLVDSAPPSKECVFVNVGDALHVDNRTNKTPAHSNPLDADSRYYRIIKVFVWAMIHAIEKMLEKHEQVTVINAAGNHDPDSTHWIQLALSMYFSNQERVDVRVDPASYHYYRFGSTLIGITHGDGAKHEELPLIMAGMKSEDWGQTKHRYWFTGHIHHKVVKEFNGCKVESFNTLAPSDAWHSKSGYFAAREMQCLVLHKDHGIVARNICPVGLAHQ